MSIGLSGSGAGLIRSASTFSINASFTFACWAYFGAVGARQSVYSNGNGTNDNAREWGTIEAANIFRMRAFNDTGSNMNIADSVATGSINTWYYLAFRRSGTTVSVVLDGTQIATDTSANTRALDASVLELGLNNGTSNPMTGRIAYARAWTSALTDGQLATERTSPTAVITANLWGDWALTSHLSLVDSSGNSRDFSAVGTLTTQADPPAVVTGGSNFGPLLGMQWNRLILSR